MSSSGSVANPVTSPAANTVGLDTTDLVGTTSDTPIVTTSVPETTVVPTTSNTPIVTTSVPDTTVVPTTSNTPIVTTPVPTTSGSVLSGETTSTPPVQTSDNVVTSNNAVVTPTDQSSNSAVVTSDSGPSVVYTTVTFQNGTVETSTISKAENKSSSNTGAIVGGVVGGVVGLALIIAVLVFLLRRRRKNYRDDFDDMMFDPARAQNHAPVDLADDGGVMTVEPYGYQGGVASTTSEPEMTQYTHSATLSPVAPASHSATSESGYYAGADGLSHATSSSAGYAGRGAGAGGLNAFPTAVPTGAAGAAVAGSSALYDASNPTAGMTAKQFEAYQESQRFHVQNQPTSPTYAAGPSAGGSSAPGGPVTVHQDGGAYEDDNATGNEIPPTYDSLPNSRFIEGSAAPHPPTSP